MTRLHSRRLLVLLPLLALALSPCRMGRSQDSAVANAKRKALLEQSRPTAEYRRLNAWWPTRELDTTAGYAGDAACAACHADLVASQAQSQMARTLTPADRASAPARQPRMTYANGDFHYALQRSATDLTVSVTDGKTSRSAAATWAFGSGDVGQSYLWQQDGAFQESRFNYFDAIHGLAATPGRLHGMPTSMVTALGRRVEGFEARTCFACHVTAMSTAPIRADAPSFVAGVHCEACHGPARDHIAAARAAQASSARDWKRQVVNFADWSPAKAVDGCGSCHGTPWDVLQMGATGRQTVRFPAYRLEQSRCWGASGDARLTCTGCHDPHQPLEKNDVAYDAACLACHAPKTAGAATLAGASEQHVPSTCPVSTSQCVRCHMPKVELPEMHHAFTDHRIRIVRGEAVPD